MDHHGPSRRIPLPTRQERNRLQLGRFQQPLSSSDWNSCFYNVFDRLGGAILCMSQVYYTGPIAVMAMGDM